MTIALNTKPKINYYDVYNCFAYHNVKTIIFFIESHGYDNIKDEHGNNPLHLACDFGYTELVDYLIQSGVDIYPTNNNHETPLFVASWHGLINKDIIKLFINQGIDINIQDNLGNTLLHNACQSSSYEIIEFLLTQNTDTTIKNNHSQTALDIAKEYMVPEIINVFNTYQEYNDLKQSILPFNKKIINRFKL